MDVVLGVVLGMVLAASLAAAWRLLRAPRRVLDPGGAAMQAAVHAATAILPHLRRGLSAESAAPATTTTARAIRSTASSARTATRACTSSRG